LTKSYEDAISDVLAILEVYTGVGVYNVNLMPIINRIKALNTTDPKELKPDITKDLKNSREVYNNPYEMEYNV
jgi:septin family protein